MKIQRLLLLKIMTDVPQAVNQAVNQHVELPALTKATSEADRFSCIEVFVQLLNRNVHAQLTSCR